jgi:putative sterol carrier protein
MSDVVSAAVSALSQRVEGKDIDFTAKFVIEDEGAVLIAPDGVSADDGEADVTLKADAETFEGILRGDVNPTSAFMTGRLSVDGDMSLAMRLGAILS